MKKHISLILISTFMILFNSPLCAMNPTEEEFKSTLLKIRGIFESRKAYSQDRHYSMIVHSLTLQRDGLQTVAQNLGVKEPSDQFKKNLPSYIEQEKATAAHNRDSFTTVLNWIMETEQESPFSFAATNLFEKLYSSRWVSLDTRLQRKCGGNLFSTLPEDINRQTNSFDREITIRVRDAFQEREHVLCLLYPFVDPVYLKDNMRLSLSLDKGLLAKLSKKTKDMGDPDSAFETFPFPGNLKIARNVYPQPIKTATEITSPQEKKKIRKALKERNPLAVYLRNVIIETATSISINRGYAIDWDALQKIPFQNQVSVVKAQGFKLQAPPSLIYDFLMDQVTKKQLEEKEQKRAKETKAFSAAGRKEEKEVRNGFPSVSVQISSSSTASSLSAAAAAAAAASTSSSSTASSSLSATAAAASSLSAVAAAASSLSAAAAAAAQQQQPQVISETPQPLVKPAIPSEPPISSSDEDLTPGQTKPKRSNDPNYQRPEKPSREEKRKAFEALGPINPISSKTEDTTQLKVPSPIKFSKITLDVLSKLYGLGEYKSRPASELNWGDFVAAYKEIREKVDGTPDANILNKPGALRKLSGGPLQGAKRKARSFGVHEPHPTDGHTLGRGQMGRIAKHFQEKFGWTLETLRLAEE